MQDQWPLRNVFLLPRSPQLGEDTVRDKVWVLSYFPLLEHCCSEYLGRVVSTDALCCWDSSANNQHLPPSGFFSEHCSVLGALWEYIGWVCPLLDCKITSLALLLARYVMLWLFPRKFPITWYNTYSPHPQHLCHLSSQSSLLCELLPELFC